MSDRDRGDERRPRRAAGRARRRCSRGRAPSSWRSSWAPATSSPRPSPAPAWPAAWRWQLDGGQRIHVAVGEAAAPRRHAGALRRAAGEARLCAARRPRARRRPCVRCDCRGPRLPGGRAPTWIVRDDAGERFVVYEQNERAVRRARRVRAPAAPRMALLAPAPHGAARLTRRSRRTDGCRHAPPRPPRLARHPRPARWCGEPARLPPRPADLGGPRRLLRRAAAASCCCSQLRPALRPTAASQPIADLWAYVASGSFLANYARSLRAALPADLLAVAVAGGASPPCSAWW